MLRDSLGALAEALEGHGLVLVQPPPSVEQQCPCHSPFVMKDTEFYSFSSSVSFITHVEQQCPAAARRNQSHRTRPCPIPR